MEKPKNKACVYDAEAEKYREEIVEIVKNMNDLKSLKRIYNLTEYLYIHK